jgi:hypothetical protein
MNTLKESGRKSACTLAGRLIFTIGRDSEAAVGESLVIQGPLPSTTVYRWWPMP